MTNIHWIFKNVKFVDVATCDFDGRPNAAPKLVLKYDKKFIYLIDYIIGRTFINLQINPKVSLSFMNNDKLTAYQVNGSVRIISKGGIFNKIIKEFQKRKISLSVERIIEGVHRMKKHDIYELEIKKKFVIFKVKIEELVEINPSGEIERNNIR